MVEESQRAGPAVSPLPSDSVNNEQAPTILIAEDNAELRLLIRETFQINYKVLECEHGLLGWEIATEQIPDLIISDVMMPEMDGFTLCQKLKKD